MVTYQNQHHHYNKDDNETQDSCFHSTSNGSNWPGEPGYKSFGDAIYGELSKHAEIYYEVSIIICMLRFYSNPGLVVQSSEKRQL